MIDDIGVRMQQSGVELEQELQCMLEELEAQAKSCKQHLAQGGGVPSQQRLLLGRVLFDRGDIRFYEGWLRLDGAREEVTKVVVKVRACTDCTAAVAVPARMRVCAARERHMCT